MHLFCSYCYILFQEVEMHLFCSYVRVCRRDALVHLANRQPTGSQRAFSRQASVFQN